jgi:hypothetical protein
MMKTTGDRASWLTEVADQIMDGGLFPPSIDRLCLIIPDKIVTAINDGHNTAAAAFGEAKRDDYRAGQRVIITEMVQLLREQQFVNGDDIALRWVKPLDGEWQVAVGDRQFTIRGQRERRLIHERYLLGERDEDSNEFRIGLPGILEGEKNKARPFAVDVIKPRGGTKPMEFQVHELALAIPPMSQREREILRDSIARDGVKVPLEIYEGKVLDGRNRLYFASVLKKPVHIKEFVGTQEEARRHVANLNLARRHLNPLQRALAVGELYGADARRKAEEALQAGRILGNQNRSPSTPNLGATAQRQEWHQIAAVEANKDGWNVTAASVREAVEIIDAPKTRAAVESGEIKIASRAKRRARTEKGKAQSTPRERNGEYTSNRLGTIIEFLGSVLEIEIVPERSISERLDQIEQLIPQLRESLRQRKIIK